MRVVLVRPTTFLNMNTYPLNIGYIYSSLASENYITLDFIDGEKIGLKYTKDKDIARKDPNHALWKEIALNILKSHPDIVALSCYSVSMTAANYIVRILRQRCGFKGHIWIGGIHATTCFRDTLEKIKGLNGVVIGEGETTFKDVLRSIYFNRGLSGVNGIAYKANGEIKVNPCRSLMDNLDKLPIPLRTFSAKYKYDNHIVLTSRGCPYDCGFCNSKDIWTQRVRYRSGEHVAREIESIAELGINSIGLRDDTFTLNIKHMEKVYMAIKERGLDNIKYNIGSRIDTINTAKIALLKKMNTSFISFGVETGSLSIQKKIKKNINPDKIIPTVQEVNNAGIRTITFFMLGHPQETEEDIKETFSLIRGLAKYCKRHNMVSINIVCPYPGTNYWKYAVDKYGDFIDFYNKSFRYYHQADPFVNITDMDDKTFLYYISRIRRYSNIVNAVYRINTALENPTLLAEKIRKSFAPMTIH